MFGTKINEFDNSEGTIKAFNNIFPKTPMGLSRGEYVEIGDIIDFDNIFQGSPFIRQLIFFNERYEEIERIKHDFGENNFYYNEDFLANDMIRFKYYVRDLDENTIAKGYNCKEVADKLGCHESVIKSRLVKTVDKNSNTKFLFNVTRKEL